jgi:hypothetical protein
MVASIKHVPAMQDAIQECHSFHRVRYPIHKDTILCAIVVNYIYHRAHDRPSLSLSANRPPRQSRRPRHWGPEASNSSDHEFGINLRRYLVFIKTSLCVQATSQTCRDIAYIEIQRFDCAILLKISTYD